MTADEAKRRYVAELQKRGVDEYTRISVYFRESIACMVEVMAVATEQATEKSKPDVKLLEAIEALLAALKLSRDVADDAILDAEQAVKAAIAHARSVEEKQ